MKYWIVPIFIISIALGWMFQWQTVNVSSGGEYRPQAFLVNRWTGEIRFLVGTEWMLVEERKRTAPEKK